MQVLTEEEISAIGVGAEKYARAVEAAVLEKLMRQEPVVMIKRNASGQIYMVGSDGNSFDMSKHVGKSLYAAPVPAAVPEG